MSVSVMIYTLNEEINLPCCLESLRWCDDVIIIDSFSTDKTESICKEFGARFYQNKFTGFGDQRNWSLDNAKPKYDWILILDADEKVPEELQKELKEIAEADPKEMGAYRVRRRFHLWGRWLKRSALYPTWVVRFIRFGKVQYVNRGHAETQEVDGEIGALNHDIHDENLKGFDEWKERQERYSRKEAEYETSLPPLSWSGLFAHDPLKRRAAGKQLVNRMPFRGLWYFLYAYFVRMGFLDGLAGLRFCWWRAHFQNRQAKMARALAKEKKAASATSGSTVDTKQ